MEIFRVHLYVAVLGYVQVHKYMICLFISYIYTYIYIHVSVYLYNHGWPASMSSAHSCGADPSSSLNGASYTPL